MCPYITSSPKDGKISAFISTHHGLEETTISCYYLLGISSYYHYQYLVTTSTDYNIHPAFLTDLRIKQDVLFTMTV